MRYLAIAYKPSSDDFCRGCHMGNYDSVFQLRECETEEEVIDFISYFLAEPLGPNEEGYEFNVYGPDVLEETWELNDAIYEEAVRKRESLDRAEKERKKQLLAQQKKEADKKEFEQFQELQKKWGLNAVVSRSCGQQAGCEGESISQVVED